MATKQIVCASCGFKNASNAQRCVSCGSKVNWADLTKERVRSEDQRYQQEGFSIVWFLIAIVVQALLTGAIIWGLPHVVHSLDFEGSHGMIASIAIWFLGGALVGLISPGRTFLEPNVATIVVAVPTVMYLRASETVFKLPTFLYVVLGCIGILFSLIGSYAGERIQMGPAPKTH